MGEGEYTLKGNLISGTGADVDLCQPDPRRVSVIFSQTVGGAGAKIEARMGQQSNPQYLMVNGVEKEFYFARHGPLPAIGFRAIALAIGTTIGVTEIIYLGKREG